MSFYSFYRNAHPSHHTDPQLPSCEYRQMDNFLFQAFNTPFSHVDIVHHDMIVAGMSCPPCPRSAIPRPPTTPQFCISFQPKSCHMFSGNLIIPPHPEIASFFISHRHRLLPVPRACPVLPFSHLNSMPAPIAHCKNTLSTCTLVLAVSEPCSPSLMSCIICTILTVSHQHPTTNTVDKEGTHKYPLSP